MPYNMYNIIIKQTMNTQQIHDVHNYMSYLSCRNNYFIQVISTCTYY